MFVTGLVVAPWRIVVMSLSISALEMTRNACGRTWTTRVKASVERKSTLLSRSATIVAERGLSVSSAISPVSSPRPTSLTTT